MKNEKLLKAIYAYEDPSTLNNVLRMTELETRIRIYYKRQRIYDGLLRDLPYGKIQGYLNKGCYSLLVNPYAKKRPGLIIRLTSFRYELKEVFIPS